MTEGKISWTTAEAFVAGGTVGGMLFMYGWKRMGEENAVIVREKRGENVPPAEQVTGVSWISYTAMVVGLLIILLSFFGVYYYRSK